MSDLEHMRRRAKENSINGPDHCVVQYQSGTNGWDKRDHAEYKMIHGFYDWQKPMQKKPMQNWDYEIFEIYSNGELISPLEMDEQKAKIHALRHNRKVCIFRFQSGLLSWTELEYFQEVYLKMGWTLIKVYYPSTGLWIDAGTEQRNVYDARDYPTGPKIVETVQQIDLNTRLIPGEEYILTVDESGTYYINGRISLDLGKGR